MNSLVILFFSTLASFVGSLQLGPVNIFVINTTINYSKKKAYLVAVGGVIPEFIYCGLAVFSGNFFLNNTRVFVVFKVVLIILLICIAIYYFLKKYKPIIHNSEIDELDKSTQNHFLKGFTLALLNPQLLPFWLFTMVYFNSISFLTLKTGLNKIAYILGAGLGAFFLLCGIILTIHKFKTQIINYLNNKYYNKLLALLFLAIALQQLFTLL